MENESKRRDRLGRRIGRNWWREYVTDLWASADHAWWLQAEAVAVGYDTELEEYAQAHPRPRFKDFLVELAGSGHSSAQAA